MELIIEAMRLGCQGVNIFENLTTLGRKAQVTFWISSNSFMFKPCLGFHYHTATLVQVFQSSQARAESWGRERPFCSEGTIWESAERQAAIEQRECCGNVIFTNALKNVLNNCLPTHMLFSYTVSLMLLPSRGEVLCSFPLNLVLWWKWHTLTSETRS